MLIKLDKEILGVLLLDDNSHGSAARRHVQSRREVYMDLGNDWGVFGRRRLDMNKGNLLDEDHHTVLESYCFHGLFSNLTVAESGVTSAAWSA
jgi:hypothetical protein